MSFHGRFLRLCSPRQTPTVRGNLRWGDAAAAAAGACASCETSASATCSDPQTLSPLSSPRVEKTWTRERIWQYGVAGRKKKLQTNNGHLQQETVGAARIRLHSDLFALPLVHVGCRVESWINKCTFSTFRLLIVKKRENRKNKRFKLNNASKL